MSEIRIFCDDPKHKRGKVAEIDTLTKLDGWESWITKEQLAETGRPRQHGWGAGLAPWGDRRHLYCCRLCGLTLTCSSAFLDRALDGLAEHGESSTTLRLLVLLASNKRA